MEARSHDDNGMVGGMFDGALMATSLSLGKSLTPTPLDGGRSGRIIQLMPSSLEHSTIPQRPHAMAHSSNNPHTQNGRGGGATRAVNSGRSGNSTSRPCLEPHGTHVIRIHPRCCSRRRSSKSPIGWIPSPRKKFESESHPRRRTPAHHRDARITTRVLDS
jgi:hypothetical protein